MPRLFNLFYAPYAAAMMAASVFTLCCFIIPAPTLRLRRSIGRSGVRAMLVLCGVPFRVRGLERLPKQPSIVICNHASYLDGLILTAALPAHFTFVVQDGAESWPLLGTALRRMGVSFINRREARAGAAQAKALIRELQSGTSLAIFAEGTFEDAPGLLPFKNGAFMMAARAKVPVVPTVIRGSRQLWGGGRKLPRWNPIDVDIFDPLPAPASSSRADTQQLQQSIRTVILQHCGEPDAHASARVETESET